MIDKVLQQVNENIGFGGCKESFTKVLHEIGLQNKNKEGSNLEGQYQIKGLYTLTIQIWVNEGIKLTFLLILVCPEIKEVKPGVD